MTNLSALLLLNGDPLTLAQLDAAASARLEIALSPASQERMIASRAVVDRAAAGDAAAYGINTGFGKLADVRVPPDQVAVLQQNLVRSHCCGVGEPLSEAEVRGMLLLRANVLAKGCSGVRTAVAELLVAMLKHRIHPVVPSRGSVGASGDLAPLAHLALALIGEGEVFVDGRRAPASEALAAAGLAPLRLQAKEGLALLNGTQAMASVGGLSLFRAQRVVRLFDLAGAMSLEGLRGTPAAFDARIHEVRPHAGQIAAATHLRALMEESEIRESHRLNDPRVQDAYCLRCMPQVHGAVRGVLDHATAVIETETGSATDNPLIFTSDAGGDILSGGNFHGAPLAFALDYAAIGLADLLSISERRIDRLINPDINEGLPPFLSDNPGISSGFMIAHVTSAALLNEAKVLAHPASVDSVPTSGGKEDHVSMGMTAALKLRQVVENAEMVLGIELMTAAQALEFRLPLRAALKVEAARARVREFVAPLREDRVLAGDITKLAAAIRAGAFDEWLG
ncbi:MAG TPA: histidine ammonia-lyase [Acidobacteriaceae bacterium]|nr:histidine ammonia-lyase [Acidobacteriaceae bacterium]